MGETALVAVALSRVGKAFRGRAALRDATLEVRRGELHGLAGPDGAGKSTLLRIVAGVLAHDAGDVDVLGTRVVSERSAEAVKPRLGFMPQGLGGHLYRELSVAENVSFFARLRVMSREDFFARRERLLAMTRLERFVDVPVKHLSGGMRQKLGLVCALIHAPELLILDEPTTGVDPLSRRELWMLLERIVHEHGTTAIVSSSYADEVDRFDRVSIMDRGSVASSGTPGEIRMRLMPVREAVRPPLRTAGTRPEPAIEARSLTRDYGALRAVNGVSLGVLPGEIVGLVGANGAGKTTLIKMLTGLIEPTSGTALVLGADMAHAAGAARAVRERIGYMSQAFSLYDDLSVVENVRLYTGVYGLARATAREGLDWVLTMAGLREHRGTIAGRLPVGMRQRLALGCAVVHRPSVLFLDEPTSGVDADGRARFWDILAALTREERVAVLLSTHDMADAEQCDRVALLFAGELVADAAPDALQREATLALGREATMGDVFIQRAMALDRGRPGALTPV